MKTGLGWSRRNGPRARLAPVLGLSGCLLFLAGAGGCRTGATGVAPARAVISPDWNSLGISTLAYLGTGGSTGNETDRLTAEAIVERELLSDQSRFVIIGLSEAGSRAAANNGSDAFQRTIKIWRDTRKADQFLVQEVCRKVGVDGIIFADLTDWEKKKSGLDTGGNSFTQVTLRLAIYSAKTGLPAWDAEKLQRKEAVRLSAESIADPVQTMAEEKQISHPTRTASEPPRPEDVAVQAMRSLMAAFPARAAR
jgi:hypothetical protein